MKIQNIQGGYGITLAQARQYLRVDSDYTDEDTLISSLITASYYQVIAECNRDFVQTAYTMSVVSSSGDIFVTAQDVTNLSTGSLQSPNGVSYAYFDNYYTGQISYTVASGSTSVPANVSVAQMMLVSQWYDNRQPQVAGTVTKLDFTVSALLAPYKLVTPSYDPPSVPPSLWAIPPTLNSPYYNL